MSSQNWEDEYKVGIAVIDAQHKRLFQGVLELQAELTSSTPPDIVVDRILRLQEYCVDHFSAEKALLAPYANEISLYYEHMAQHHGFVQVTDIYVKRAESEGAAVVDALCVFLQQWLKEHIKVMDVPSFKALAALKK